MSELLQIEAEITDKSVEQAVRINLLNRLMELADEYPAPAVADVIVRALEREVWRLSAEQTSDYLNMLIEALNKLQHTYTRVWNETTVDEHSSHVERAEQLEKVLENASLSDDERIQVIFNQVKGLPFSDLDARWDVLHARFAQLCYKVQFATAYAVCVNCTNEARHPMFEQAVQLVADAAMNNEDKTVLADALIALRAAQRKSLATDGAAAESDNRKFISRLA